jgi:hypothetical protein
MKPEVTPGKTQECSLVPTDKATFLKSMKRLFPDLRESAARLEVLENASPGQDDWNVMWERNFEVGERILLPLWQSLCATYAAVLAAPFGNDPGVLSTVVEDWPDTLEKQQKSLHQLLGESKLRQAWRGYGAWISTQRTFFTDGQRKVSDEIEREMCDANAPLREIPLYHAWLRTSCQQVVCMPVQTWRCLYANSKYEPQHIDQQVVNRLSRRLALVFNTPPVTDEATWRASPSWREAIVWGTSARGLTTPMECHGIRDRMEDVGGLPAGENLGRELTAFPNWRYEGFCGQIRVTLEDGQEWFVTVLAPLHFLRHLVRSVLKSRD